MAALLFAWIGGADLRAAAGEGEAGRGPIAAAAADRRFDELVLLSSHDEDETDAFVGWLRAQVDVPLVVHREETTAVGYRDIHDLAVRAVLEARQRHGRDARLTFHLSPGAPAMAAVWILLAQTRFQAELIESSKARGVWTSSVALDLSGQLLPELLHRADEELAEQTAEWSSAGAAGFAAIVGRSAPMRRLIARARRVALRRVPLLIEGESGTGKELIARAIHEMSAPAGAPFIAVNCGAIPEGLVESELFGHERGAFTGAAAARPGHFREAHGGTLFLDEIGELPLPAQVKLLRALQEREVTPVGASRPIAVDARVMAATHRNLLGDVAADRFRADLFYRLAVAVLQVPALRERPGDLDLLTERLLEQINAEHAGDPGYSPKKLGAGARAVLAAHTWPGNVRELQNTLRRAALWSAGASLLAEDIRDAMIDDPRGGGANPLARPLGDGFSLPAVLGDVARHYLERALAEAGGNRSRAAALLGLGSHQTLANWLARHGVEVARRKARR